MSLSDRFSPVPAKHSLNDDHFRKTHYEKRLLLPFQVNSLSIASAVPAKHSLNDDHFRKAHYEKRLLLPFQVNSLSDRFSRPSKTLSER
ncbi:hypothetical protein J6590_043689 [Homalodisca vitripennis]|nr:hypothetical protein J6590_043689 [Homalodisca vitripennis]